MCQYIKEYFDKENLYIKFEGFKNNNKNEGICKIGFISDSWLSDYGYEEVNFIDSKKNGEYKLFKASSLCKNGYTLKEIGTYSNDEKINIISLGPKEIYTNNNYNNYIHFFP
jgi:hypothetical protein